MITRIKAIVQKHGISGMTKVAYAVLYDRAYDAYHRLDTSKAVQLHEQSYVGVDVEHAKEYVASRATHFMSLMDRVDLPENPVLVDYGSGKGKVLFLGLKYNFQRLVGIEFSRNLYEVANTNLENCRFMPSKDLSSVEFFNMDAREYTYTGDENVFYFFNPFDQYIMESVVEKIFESIEKNPRESLLIINNNRYKDMLAAYPQLTKEFSHAYATARFDVYSINTSTPA